MKRKIIKTSELQLGDVVRPTSEVTAFSGCVVSKIEEDKVHFYRPYAHKSSGLMLFCYIGLDEHWVPRNNFDHITWELWERSK